MISPISWLHHYVWIVPLLVWLVCGLDRPARGVWWAVVGASVFACVPQAHAHVGVLGFLLANSYVVATVAFIVLTAVMLWRRRGTVKRSSLRHHRRRHRSESSVPTSLPSGLGRAHRCVSRPSGRLGHTGRRSGTSTREPGGVCTVRKPGSDQGVQLGETTEARKALVLAPARCYYRWSHIEKERTVGIRSGRLLASLALGMAGLLALPALAGAANGGVPTGRSDAAEAGAGAVPASLQRGHCAAGRSLLSQRRAGSAIRPGPSGHDVDALPSQQVGRLDRVQHRNGLRGEEGHQDRWQRQPGGHRGGLRRSERRVRSRDVSNRKRSCPRAQRPTGASRK